MSQVAYQPDIAAALEVARWDAFRGGDFHRTDNLPQARTMTEDEFVEWLVEDFGPGAEPEARFAWQAIRAGEPQDPDTLRAIHPESGTHSVIDMDGVSGTPDTFKVAPATHGVAEAVAAGKLDLYDRWHGTYVIGYRNAPPDVIFFVGHSGD